MSNIIFKLRIAENVKLQFHQEVFVESCRVKNFVRFSATSALINTNAKGDKMGR